MKKIIKQSLSTSLLGEFAPVLVNLIGSCNEDGSPHLCGASWVSFTLGPPRSIVFSTFVEPAVANIMRTGEFTVNMCTGEMAETANGIYWKRRLKQSDEPDSNYEWGRIVRSPVLNASPFACECKVAQSHIFGDSQIFFAEIVNQQIDVKLGKPINDSDEAYIEWLENLDVNELNPLLWLGNYYKIGKVV